MAWTVGDRPGAQMLLMSEEVADDSDKSLVFDTVLGSYNFTDIEIVGIRVEYVATATAGTRDVTIEIQDSGSDVIFQLESSTGPTATNTILFEFMPNGPTATHGATQKEYLPPKLMLGTGQTLRIYDASATDAAADDVVMHVRALISSGRAS